MRSLDTKKKGLQTSRRFRAACYRAKGRMMTGTQDLLSRSTDVFLASFLLMLLAPVLAIRAIWAYRSSGRIWERSTALGRHREIFERLEFAGPARGKALASLFQVFSGERAFAGPRPLSPRDDVSLSARHLMRFATRPGLVSPHRLRASVGIAYAGEMDDDVIFAIAQSLRGDLGLVARWLPATVLGAKVPQNSEKKLSFLDVTLDNVTMEDAVDRLAHSAAQKRPLRVSFVNPDCLNLSTRNENYRRAVTSSDLVLADGIGLQIAGRILGTPLTANVNGTDLFPILCERAAREGLSLYLLGARPGVAEAAARSMRDRVPSLSIVGTQDGYFQPEEESEVIGRINRSGADILLVAFGAPRQETWLAEHQEHLEAPVLLGVGGLFDFYSGRIPRAPIWLREMGMEWVWRLLQEPGRMWRRYVIGNPIFLARVAGQKLREWKASRDSADAKTPVVASDSRSV